VRLTDKPATFTGQCQRKAISGMFAIDGIENAGYDFGGKCWETEGPDFRKDANWFDNERKKVDCNRNLLGLLIK
jgi:hypothetical protein